MLGFQKQLLLLNDLFLQLLGDAVYVLGGVLALHDVHALYQAVAEHDGRAHERELVELVRAHHAVLEHRAKLLLVYQAVHVLVLSAQHLQLQSEEELPRAVRGVRLILLLELLHLHREELLDAIGVCEESQKHLLLRGPELLDGLELVQRYALVFLGERLYDVNLLLPVAGYYFGETV